MKCAVTYKALSSILLLHKRETGRKSRIMLWYSFCVPLYNTLRKYYKRKICLSYTAQLTAKPCSVIFENKPTKELRLFYYFITLEENYRPHEIEQCTNTFAHFCRTQLSKHYLQHSFEPNSTTFVEHLSISI